MKEIKSLKLGLKWKIFRPQELKMQLIWYMYVYYYFSDHIPPTFTHYHNLMVKKEKMLTEPWFSTYDNFT